VQLGLVLDGQRRKVGVRREIAARADRFEQAVSSTTMS
jgi:hypothetical protein